jgi:hypothetical protein
MKKRLRTSSVIALLALISILILAFSGTNNGYSISAPTIGVAGITIVLILAFAFSREDQKGNHEREN